MSSPSGFEAYSRLSFVQDVIIVALELMSRIYIAVRRAALDGRRMRLHPMTRGTSAGASDAPDACLACSFLSLPPETMSPAKDSSQSSQRPVKRGAHHKHSVFSQRHTICMSCRSSTPGQVLSGRIQYPLHPRMGLHPRRHTRPSRRVRRVPSARKVFPPCGFHAVSPRHIGPKQRAASP